MKIADLEKKFDKAAKDAKKLPFQPGAEVLLKLYGLYKQATVGDVEGKRPGILDFVARSKFDAWTLEKGQSKKDSMIKYIELVEKLYKQA